MKKSEAIYLIIIQIVGICGLSFFSTYHLPEYERMTGNIATMLTPFGIIYNLFVDEFSDLKVYYFLQNEGNISFLSRDVFILFIFFTFLMCNFGLYKYISHRNSSQSRKPL